MTNRSSENGHESGYAPMALVNAAVEDQITVPVHTVRKRPNRRDRAISPQRTLTASLVISGRNEAGNTAWVLEQIADDVDEIVLVDGEDPCGGKRRLRRRGPKGVVGSAPSASASTLEAQSPRAPWQRMFLVAAADAGLASDLPNTLAD
jgi:hypothetical protein